MQLLRLLADISSANGEKSAFVAAMQVFQKSLRGHYYSVIYGRVGCSSVDVFHPEEGWLGIDSNIAKTIARHHFSHPFSVDFFFRTRSAVYLRSRMVGEEAWRQTPIYNLLDAPLGIADMIGMYFPMPSGQFGALFCGSKSLFDECAFEDAKVLHKILYPIFVQVPEVSPEADPCSTGSCDLSAREQDVMDWLAQGKSNHDIGVILGISPHTVRKHLENIFRKLGVENRTAAVREFREKPHGLEPPRISASFVR